MYEEFTGMDLLPSLYLRHWHLTRVEGRSVVVTTTSQFDMVTSVKDNADETSLDSRWSNHNRRFTEKRMDFDHYKARNPLIVVLFEIVKMFAKWKWNKSLTSSYQDH